MTQSQLWRVSLLKLGSTFAEAVELAHVFNEAFPHIIVDGFEHDIAARTTFSSGTPSKLTARDRLKNGHRFYIDEGRVPWHQLKHVVSSESLEDSFQSDDKMLQVVEVNTGGKVFFCFFRITGERCRSGNLDLLMRAESGGSCSSSIGSSSTAWAASMSPPTPAMQTPPSAVATSSAVEMVAVMKFANSRLLMQAEQFANELTRHLDIGAPECRIVREAGATSDEFRAALEAAEAVGESSEEVVDELRRFPCFLLMEYVHGSPLMKAQEAFQGPALIRTVHDLGRLLLLDMLLGNADRLPCADLGWRGNPSNVLYGGPRSNYDGRLVAIDSCVQRRPPAHKSSAEDDAVERVTQLVLNAPGEAERVLRQVLSCSPLAISALESCPAQSVVFAAFQGGLRSCLTQVLNIKGLLEMVRQAMEDWIDEFMEDIQKSNPDLKISSLEPPLVPSSAPPRAPIGRGAADHPPRTPPQPARPHSRLRVTLSPITSPRKPSYLHSTSMPAAPSPRRATAPSPTSPSPVGSPPSSNGSSTPAHLRVRTTAAAGHGDYVLEKSMTMTLKTINYEAQKNDTLGDRLEHWKQELCKRGQDLKHAMNEWQERHAVDRVLTTGFLDGTHPIVDSYELKVRLTHMLRRLQALQGAAAACAPIAIEPRLYLGTAVSADAHHLLRHLGVTHSVNATEELLLPPESAGFTCIRVPLRDVDDEDIATHFDTVSNFISEALQREGGGVLVHCAEGKSRSVTLVVAHLMISKRWTLKRALDFVRQRRSEANPNAGFLQRLLELDERLHGRRSMVLERRGKPDPRVCPVCHAPVGISSQSLAVHLKAKHGGAEQMGLLAAQLQQQQQQQQQQHQHHQRPASAAANAPAAELRDLARAARHMARQLSA